MGSAMVCDERLATILMQHFLADAHAGWAGWARLNFVNKAFAIVFSEYGSKLVDLRNKHMQLLIEAKNREFREKDRQLWIWMKHCRLRAFIRDYDSDDGEDSEDVGVSEAEPATIVWY